MISAIKNIKRVFSQNGGGGGAAVNLVGSPCEIQLAASDESTALTTGTSKVSL
jgi:hypothetical protein